MRPRIKIEVKPRKRSLVPSALTPVDGSKDEFRKYMKDLDKFEIEYPDILVKEKRKIELKKKRRFQIHRDIMGRKRERPTRMKAPRKKPEVRTTFPPLYRDSPIGRHDMGGRSSRNTKIKKLENRLGKMMTNPFTPPRTKMVGNRAVIKEAGSRTLPLIRKYRKMKETRSLNHVVEEAHLPNLNLLEFEGEPEDKRSKRSVNPSALYFQNQDGLLLQTDEDNEEISFRVAPVKIHNHELTQKYLEEKIRMKLQKNRPNQKNVATADSTPSKHDIEVDEDGFQVPTKEWIRQAQEELSFKKKKRKTKLDPTMVIPMVDQEGELPIPPPLPASPPTPDYMKEAKILDLFKSMKKEAMRRNKAKEKAKISYIAPNPAPNLTPIEVTRTYDPNNAVGSRLTPPTPPPRERSSNIFTYFNTTPAKSTTKKKKLPAYIRSSAKHKRRRSRMRRTKKERKEDVKKVLDTLLGGVEDSNEHGTKPHSAPTDPVAPIGKPNDNKNKENEPRAKFGEYDWEFKKGRFSQRKLNPAYRLYAKRDKRSKLVFYEMSFNNADLRNIRLFQKTINSIHGNVRRRNNEIGKVY